MYIVQCTTLSKYGELIIGKKVMRILEKHPFSSIVNSLPLIPNRKFAVIIAKSPIFPISHQSPIPTSYSPLFQTPLHILPTTRYLILPTSYSPLFPLSTVHAPISTPHSPLSTPHSPLPIQPTPHSPLTTRHSPVSFCSGR